jgi:biotin carboxyl carrier protein
MRVLVDNEEIQVYIDRIDGKGRLNGKEFDLDLTKIEDHFYSVELDGKTYSIQVLPGDNPKKPKIRVNGISYDTELIDKYDELIKSLGMENMTKVEIKELKSPMPGLVFKIDIKVGDPVQKGDPLMILEAMKMENVIKSRGEGVIAEIMVSEGQAVEKGELLIRFE